MNTLLDVLLAGACAAAVSAWLGAPWYVSAVIAVVLMRSWQR